MSEGLRRRNQRYTPWPMEPDDAEEAAPETPEVEPGGQPSHVEPPHAEHSSEEPSTEEGFSAPPPRAEPEPAEPKPGPGDPTPSQPAPSAEVASPQPTSLLQSTGDAGYRISLPMFEGPLDLLLHLVKKHELNLLDIPIAFITEKYTAYIRLLDELNIDVASEYLLMAATLLHLKSRMLLPNPPDDEVDETLDESELDPRAELVRRLLEYQKYKLAAEELSSRNLLGRDVFPRGSSDEVASGQPALEAVSMFRLLDAFQAVLERTHQNQEHQIDFDRFSIAEKISELSDLLAVRKKLTFQELFPDRTSRAELIMTFLALLEMTRLRMIHLTQEGPLATIYIELRVPDDESLAPDLDAAPDDIQTFGDEHEYE
jgi:segregation and condensation protein A